MKITPAQILTQIKTWIFPILIFFLTFVLVKELVIYLSGISITHLSFTAIPKIAGITLLLAFVIALSSPAWDGWIMLLIVPFPLSLGVYLNLLNIEPLNALLGSFAIFLVTTHHVERSARLNELFIRSRPYFSLRPAIKGYLIAVSLAAAFIFLLNPTQQEVNLGDTVSDAIAAPVRRILNEEIGLSQFPGQDSIEKEIQTGIETQVKNAIEPYKQLINVAMSVAIYIGMHGVTVAVYLVYSIFVAPLFWLAKKIKLIEVTMEEVQKETLHF